MKHLPLTIVSLMLFVARPLWGADVEGLAACTTKVFSEMHRTKRWSGEAPAGCLAEVGAFRHVGGVRVAAWIKEKKGEGWVLISFSAVETMAEIADAKKLAAANRDIKDRAGRLKRCLNRADGGSHPECRDRGAREYLADDESGVRDLRRITLGDAGRDTELEYLVSDTVATPDLPAETPDDEPLPPGTELKVFMLRTQ